MARTTYSMCIVFSLIAASTLCGQDETPDPFKTEKVVVKAPKAKTDKVVVDTKTLDLVMDWLDENLAIGAAYRQSSMIKKQIDELKGSNDEDLEKIARLETSRKQLLDTIYKREHQLGKIPVQTTFDLERWAEFKEELRVRRNQFRQILGEMDALKDENARLREEIAKLRSEK